MDALVTPEVEAGNCLDAERSGIVLDLWPGQGEHRAVVVRVVMQIEQRPAG
jgi:hypothetical protein